MGNFQLDLPFGEQAEREVAVLLKPSAEQNGYFFVDDKGRQSHDLLFVNPFKSSNIKVEVKWDRESEKTGNIAIELKCSGKFSGINKTEATFWVIKFWDVNMWVYRAVYVDRLQHAIREKVDGDWRYRRANGGDQFRAEMVLIPVEDFKRMSSEVK